MLFARAGSRHFHNPTQCPNGSHSAGKGTRADDRIVSWYLVCTHGSVCHKHFEPLSFATFDFLLERDLEFSTILSNVQTVATAPGNELVWMITTFASGCLNASIYILDESTGGSVCHKYFEPCLHVCSSGISKPPKAHSRSKL